MTFSKVGRAVMQGAAIMSLIMAAAVYSQTHFTFTSNTGNNMTVGIQASINPTVNGTAIANNDEIGVFDGSLCVGACVWTGSTTAITVWGACSIPVIVGATVGDTLKYRVWHVSTSQEIPATVTYTSGGPTYSVNGTAILASLVANTYTMTYNSNGSTGGTAPTDANSYAQGATVTVLGNTGSLVKTGSTFSGWNTAANGTGTSYAAAATFSMGTANVTLYAQWTLIPTYSVTYNGNGSTGGTTPTDANSYQQGATVTVLGNTGSLVKTGSTFSGWNTAANGTGTSYAAAATFSMGTANVTLYAQWTLIPTYSVTYNGNGSTGGTAPTDANSYQQGATVTVLGNTGSLAKTGYTFAGWNTAANGTGTSYAAAATFTMGTANVTLYAQWTLIPTYSVTYNGNGNTGGTAPTDANSYQQGATVTVLGNTGSLVKTGYTFTKWNTAADGSGTSYAAAATFTMGTTNVTLYAQWTLIPTYSVTYNGNGSTGGTVPTDANSYQQGATVTVLGNTGSLAKTGYTFAGWNTAANGTGTSYAAAATFTMGTVNVTLYAQWNINTYTLSLAHVIGTSTPVADRDTIVNYGDTVRVTAPAISGTIFLVWRITAGTAVLVDSTAQPAKVVLTSGNATLTAIYDVASGVLNRRNSLPTSFDFSYIAALSSIRIAVPLIAGYSSVPVRVSFFDARGRLLSILVNKEMQAGYYDLRLNEGNSAIPVWGICRMDAKGFSRTVKVICVK